MAAGASVLLQAHDIIYQHLGPNGIDLEAADEYLTELQIPPRQKMTILTRLSKLAINREAEANNIARALLAANWAKGQVSRHEQEDLFCDQSGLDHDSREGNDFDPLA